MDQLNSPSLSALRQVFQQQAMGQGGVLNQGNPSANIPTPGLTGGAPMPQQAGGGATPPPGQQAMPSAAVQAPPGQGLPVGDPEASIILKSLSSRLTQLGKMGR